MRALIILVILAIASPARAEKDEKVSFGLAAAGTGVSSALVVGAILFKPEEDEYSKPLLVAGLGSFLVTPSLGHLYSEQWLTLGMGIRGGAGLLALWGLSMTQDEKCTDRPNAICQTTTATGWVLVSLAAIGYVGGIAYDVRDSKDAAHRHNKKRGATLTPTAMNHGGGLSLVGRF